MFNKHKILILEDNESVLTLLQDLLVKYELECVTNGLKGLDAFKENHFKFVISDIKMPKLNGIEFAMRLRQISKIPILFISGSSFEYRDEINLISNCLYLNKPFKVDEFYIKIKEIESLIIKD